MIPRCWPGVVALALAMRFCGTPPLAHAGGFVCDATCLSKLASASSIAVNADKLATGSKYTVAVLKHPLHPKRAVSAVKSKSTKGKRT
jgi:hypothetical protein